MVNPTIKQKIIAKLFPSDLAAPQVWMDKYPLRQLPEGAMVTRFAPSPTGFMHIGGLYAALISERLAHQSAGVFYLRIEDTDKKREVAGTIKLIVDALARYGLRVDEGVAADESEFGQYGPYKQSERSQIYQSFIKLLVEQDLAYPCFSTTEELEELHQQQEAQGVRAGYYGAWAKWRSKSEEEVWQALESGQPFVIRFRSPGDFSQKIIVKDLLLGSRDMSENDQDIVIMKSDGLPTYHLAHVIDDHFMGTTHVVRGNEWLPSLPLHLQLFAALGWVAPKYGHIYPIQKMEESSKRKLSKRKDPEANIAFYAAQGYPEAAVIEYLLNLANSNFEDWRKTHPAQDNREFALSFAKLASSNGPLFDFPKLNDISKNIIATYTADYIYEQVVNWATKYDAPLAALITERPDYTKSIFNIERLDAKKVRKDLAKWSEVRQEIAFFFDELFSLTTEEVKAKLVGWDLTLVAQLVQEFLATYNRSDSAEIWFEKVKDIARAHGYAENTKSYKQNPENYRGSVGDIVNIFRLLITGKTQSPDLQAIMQVLDQSTLQARLSLLNLK
jgi:glutamyl-tRNA synthetase